MKESHMEGVAHHHDPKPCGASREGRTEASAGADVGGLLSSEITHSGRRSCGLKEQGNTAEFAMRKNPDGPAESRTLGMHRTSLRENRKVPPLPITQMGRSGKTEGYKPDMYGVGKLDPGIVPAKALNELAGRWRRREGPEV